MNDDLLIRLRGMMRHPSAKERAMYPNDDDVVQQRTLEEAIAELERLRSIVGDLAATTPVGDYWCAVCGNDAGWPQHELWCPWLRASDWCRGWDRERWARPERKAKR